MDGGQDALAPTAGSHEHPAIQRKNVRVTLLVTLFAKGAWLGPTHCRALTATTRARISGTNTIITKATRSRAGWSWRRSAPPVTPIVKSEGEQIVADRTKIEWSDATANVINGCSLESPGCTNCYAMKQAHRFPVRQGLTKKGGMVWTGEVRFHEPALLKVLSWRRPRMIFWNAHGDMFHPDVPEEWIARCFDVMARTPQHIHQVLTKRSARMREVLSGPKNHRLWHPKLWHRSVLPNVWLGVSVEDQQRADERVPDLLATPAAVRWLSCEPLLGPVDLTTVRMQTSHHLGFDALEGKRIHKEDGDQRTAGTRLDWIVAGGESGPGSRPCHPDWARSLRDQCAAADIPYFWKQWGEWLPFDQVRSNEQRDAVSRTTIEASKKGNGKQTVFGAWSNGHKFYGTPGIRPVQINAVGKKLAGRLLDGKLHEGMPVQ
jgi:protein gp37